MSKTVKMLLSLTLALALVLSLGIGAFAEESAPREFVGYGYGMPDEAKVDMHGLDAEDITLDGVSYEVKTADTYLYIRLSDLAVSKLLRENQDKASELGIDYAKLYINKGLILIKDSVPEDEAKELEAKNSQRKSGAVVGVSIGDVFDLGNGGTLKLQVEVRDFVYSTLSASAATVDDSSKSADDSNKPTDDSSKPTEVRAGMRIITGSDGYRPYYDDGGLYEKVTVTTIFYDFDGGTSFALGNTTPDESFLGGALAIAKAEDDSNTYYVEVRYADSSKNTMTKALDANDSSNDFRDCLIICFTEDENYNPLDLASEVHIYTDENRENEVQVIKLKYTTPKYDDFVQNGQITNTPPEGYKVDPKESNEFLCEPPTVTGEGNGVSTIETTGQVSIEEQPTGNSDDSSGSETPNEPPVETDEDSTILSVEPDIPVEEQP